MATNSTYSQTTIILPLLYNEIKCVCLASLNSIPTVDNYKGIIPEASEENLNNPNKLIPLQKLGGPEVGSISISDTELKFGTSYEVDDDGNIIEDENGQPIISEDNGILWGLEIPSNVKNKSFNAIIAYSTNIDSDTNLPSIGFITILSNFIKLEKILNFCVRYVLTVNLEIVNLDINYWDSYRVHTINVDPNINNFNKVHPQLTEKVLINLSQGKNKDTLNIMNNNYIDFINSESLYFQVKDDVFDENIPENQIQILRDFKINKFTDDVIRSQYIYFYYNCYLFKYIVSKGITDEYLNSEKPEDLKNITMLMIRSHMKIGFSEPAGPFLYSWFSTPSFIYIGVFGSNSNNNVDIYRIINKTGINLNAENVNLIVGKYLDRIYFTIEGILHVCVPESADKQEIPINTNSVYDAELNLTDEDLFNYYPDPVTVKNMTDSMYTNYFNEIIKDIKDNKSAKYYITLEQFYLFILSHSTTGSEFVSNGIFVPGDSGVSSATELIDQKKYFITIDDYKNVVKLLKNPTDRINNFMLLIDKLVEECTIYKEENGLESPKVQYLNQIFEDINTNVNNPSFSLGDNYKENWEGVEGSTGIKKYLLKDFFIEGPSFVDNGGNKYEDYAKVLFERIQHPVINYEMRDWLLNNTNKSETTDELNIFYDGVAERILNKFPQLEEASSVNIVKNYMTNVIYGIDNIVESETYISRFRRYAKFRRYYDYAIKSTVNLSDYVLRRYMINKAGENQTEIDRINLLTITEVTEEFNNIYLNSYLNNMMQDDWWNVSVLSNLETIYKEVSLTKCYEIIAYSEKDTFNYNGVEQKEVPLNIRTKGLPYRYGFPYPNYVYKSNESDLFIVPEHPAEEPTETYKSKISMEEALLKPNYDGTAESLEALNELVIIKAEQEVETDEDIPELTTPIGIYETEKEKDNAILIEEYVTTKDNLPIEGKEGKRYFVIDEKKAYIYNQPSYELDSNFPIIDGLYNVTSVYSYYILRYGKVTEDEMSDTIYWEEYNIPDIGTIVYSKESNKYFKYTGNDWEEITQEEYKSEFINKVYAIVNEGGEVSGDSIFYMYNGVDWELTSVSYNIPVNSIYCVTNEDEEIIENVNTTSISSETDTIASFTASSRDKIYKFNYSNVNTEESKLNFILYEILEGGSETEVTTIEADVISSELGTSSVEVEYNINKLSDYKAVLQGVSNAYLSVSYTWTRSPGDTGIKYYQWDGVKFVEYDMVIIPEANICNYKYNQFVYVNLFIEGEKLNINRDVFKKQNGETCKVVQFEFSDIGDVVLVLDYNGQGQNAWGGVFSRGREESSDGLVIKWSKNIVIDQDFKKCFNWESYNQILWSVNSDKTYEISDKRLQGVQALYEISRSHYENLSHMFDPSKMIFGNALTIAFNTDDKGNDRMKVFPKNIRMIPNEANLLYKGARIHLNNYFIIMGVDWFDMIYDRLYKMDKTTEPSDSFITASRGLCITAVHKFRDDEEPINTDGSSFDGAVTNFNINTWYNAQNIKDYFESVDIPEKKY